MARKHLFCGGSLVLVTALLAAGAADVRAQPQPDAPKPDAPPVADGEDKGPVVTQEDIEDPVAQALFKDDENNLVAIALEPHPDGITPREAASRAGATSPAVEAKKAEMRAAEAKVDQALAAYFPTLRGSATYTRLSPVDAGTFDIPAGHFHNPPDGPAIPTPAGSFGFPSLENSYQLAATLEIPISDYLLRLTQAYAAASNDVDARDMQMRATRLQAEADAKVAYFQWVNAAGQAAVAEVGTGQAVQHLGDAKIALLAGNVSEADVLRLESNVAQSKHLSNQQKALVRVSAEQLRLVMHEKPGKQLRIGIDIFEPPPPMPQVKLQNLQQSALNTRLELKAMRKTQEALEQAASATRGSYYPRLTAFGNALYANPNPRIFPQEEKFDFTWEVGARLSWTVNDTFTTIGASKELEEQANAVKAQLRSLEDGIQLSVARAYNDMIVARSAIEAATLRVKAADKGLEVRRKLFLGGRATSTDMVDGLAELTAARLQFVRSHVDVHVAQARLALAMGKSVK